MNNELLPCPFCGGNNTKLYSKNDTNLHGFIHLCDKHKDCMVKIESRLFTTEKEAVNAWNTRVAPSNELLTLEQLKECEGKPVWVEHKTKGKAWLFIENISDRFIRFINAKGTEISLRLSELNNEFEIYDHEPKGVQ